MKNVKIPEQLLYALLRYFFAEEEEEIAYIKRELTKKVQKLSEHKKYSQKLKEERTFLND